MDEEFFKGVAWGRGVHQGCGLGARLLLLTIPSIIAIPNSFALVMDVTCIYSMSS